MTKKSKSAWLKLSAKEPPIGESILFVVEGRVLSGFAHYDILLGNVAYTAFPNPIDGLAYGFTNRRIKNSDITHWRALPDFE